MIKVLFEPQPAIVFYCLTRKLRQVWVHGFVQQKHGFEEHSPNAEEVGGGGGREKGPGGNLVCNLEVWWLY